MRINIRKYIPKRIKKLYHDEDLNYIIKYSRYDVIIELLSFSIGFFNSWFFANYISFELYGNYLFILNINNFFGFLSFSGISQSLIQVTSKGYDSFLITATKKLFLYSQLGTFAILIYSIIYNLFFEFSLVIFFCLIITGVSFPFGCVILLYQNYLFGKEKYKKRFLVRSVNLIILNLSIFILIFFFRNLILYFLLYNIFQTTFNLYLMRSTIKHIDKTERDPNQDKNAMQYGMMLTKYGIIPIIASNINGLIVGMFFGPVSLAFYTVGIGLSNKLIVLTRPSLSTLFTKYSKESKISKTFIIFVICFSIFLFFAVQIILPFFLQILFPFYISSITYGRLHTFIILILPINVVFGYYFRGKIEEKIIKLSILIPNIISLIFIAPLLLIFGINGLILNEIFKNVFTLIIYFIYKNKIEFS